MLTRPINSDLATWGRAGLSRGVCCTAHGRPHHGAPSWTNLAFLPTQEEREAELESIFEQGLTTRQEANEAEEENDALGLAGEACDSATAGRRTIESVKGAERVLEALQVLHEEADRVAEHAAALTGWERRAVLAVALKQPEPPRPELVQNMLLVGLDEGRR